MNQQQARNKGFARGYKFASKSYHPENPEAWRSDAISGELLARQYVSFSFVAANLNSFPASKDLWLSFEHGVAQGIEAYINQNGSNHR